VALDASVERAELQAQEAQAALAKTTLARLEKLRTHQATSQEEVDQARAQYDVAQAEMARTRALIAKKVIRAPFRARVGIADVHIGQYLNEGAELTTLQGVADAVHVDFTVAQRVAAGLKVGDSVGVYSGNDNSRSQPASSQWTREWIPTPGTPPSAPASRAKRRRLLARRFESWSLWGRWTPSSACR
jgi:membrane fusion protein (multidrug efflux system)